MLPPRPAGLLAVAAVTTLALPLFFSGGRAEAAPRKSDIVGTWNGGGKVVLANGGSEQARCRASFRRVSARAFAMNAVCATPSARIVQTASLQQIGPTSYAGRFRNAEYDITGSVSIALKGGRMTAVLTGGGGSARFVLTR